MHHMKIQTRRNPKYKYIYIYIYIYIPKTTHDVYLCVLSTCIREGAVRSYLRDIGVNYIIRDGHESEFCIIMGDRIEIYTIYGHRKSKKDSIVMPFKRYLSHSTPIHYHYHRRPNQGESRNQTLMSDRQRTNLLQIHCCHDQLRLIWIQLSLTQ